jgi:uncharacterized protein YkwD
MGAFLSVLLVLAPVLTTPSDRTDEVRDTFQLLPVERQLIVRTNAQRARYGLPPLAVDRELVESARRHAAWMTRSHTLRHTNLPVAENIAMGQRTAAEAIQSWMTSPGHRANILHPGYRGIGAAAYTAGDGTIFWCQQFRR